MFETMKSLFASAQTVERHLYSVPFSYTKTGQDKLFGTYAYVFAISKAEATRAVRSHIQSQGCEFIELIDEIRIIPTTEWTQYVNQEWPMFKHRLPSMDELKMMDKKNTIHVLPSIEQMR